MIRYDVKVFMEEDANALDAEVRSMGEASGGKMSGRMRGKVPKSKYVSIEFGELDAAIKFARLYQMDIDRGIYPYSEINLLGWMLPKGDSEQAQNKNGTCEPDGKLPQTASGPEGGNCSG